MVVDIRGRGENGKSLNPDFSSHIPVILPMIRSMHIPSLIERKRDGGTLTDGEIGELIAAFSSGEMPEYQMSALAMAIYFTGMSREETAALTKAMLESGSCLEHPDGAPRIVDKHSTGGVGDKVSLVLAPLLACADCWVPMVSGRGLGITGGTLDKLESIPGFRVSLTTEEACLQLEKIGVVMMGQTEDICPADKKLYALRDVTATVPSQPLIVASIMSKKLAESLDALVLDVKYGSGAFMKTRSKAESLGEAMREVGEAMGVDTQVRYNPMHEPLGHSVGNALEVMEAIETLRGDGHEHLRSIVIELAESIGGANAEQFSIWLDDGSAWQKFRMMVECQGGDTEALEKLADIHSASVVREIVSRCSGRVLAVDADTTGRASVALGAGRSRSDDGIDHTVGFDRIIKIGSDIRAGEMIARVHAQTEIDAKVAKVAFLSGFKCE